MPEVEGRPKGWGSRPGGKIWPGWGGPWPGMGLGREGGGLPQQDEHDMTPRDCPGLQPRPKNLFGCKRQFIEVGSPDTHREWRVLTLKGEVCSSKGLTLSVLALISEF